MLMGSRRRVEHDADRMRMKTEPSKTPQPTGHLPAAVAAPARPGPAAGPWVDVIAEGERMTAQRRQFGAVFGPAFGAPGKPARHPVVQRQWVRQVGPVYQQDVPVDGRTWTVRLAQDAEGEDEYRYVEGDVTSAWLSAEDHVRNGHPPPQGARFAEQRRVDGGGAQDQAGADKYAFKGSTLAGRTPLTIKHAHAALAQHVARIKDERRQDKGMLDGVLYEELQRIRAVVKVLKDALLAGNLSDDQMLALKEHFTPVNVDGMVRSRALTPDQAETLAAGLRYKRLYEHEQNLLTINRRSRTDIDVALDTLADKYGLALVIEVDDDAQTEEVGVENFKERDQDPGADYALGTFFFGDARFEQVSGPLVEGGSAVYRHRETNDEYVKDVADTFMPRFVSRAIRYEDALALLANTPMPTKLDFNAPLSGKEARDYGPDFAADEIPSYDEKVMGQIRGYGRFLSATSSKHMATSTSRGTYDSPYGKVQIDLARMKQDGYHEAHSEDALVNTFDVDDLGAAEFIPKHLPGEEAKVKAARDAYRAREVVVSSPPVNAVRTVSRNTGELGLLIVGITGSADESSVRASLGKWADFVSFTEVNTDYKRDVDGHKGNTAFVFFKGIKAIGPVIADLQHVISSGRATKINATGYVKAVPGSRELSDYRNPEQVANRQADTTFLNGHRTAWDAMIRELDEALATEPASKVRRLVQGIKQQLQGQWQRLERDADQGVELPVFSTATLKMLTDGEQRLKDVRQALRPEAQ